MHNPIGLSLILAGKKKWSIVQTKGTRPGARDGHSACVINKKMYIFGGYEEELDRFSDDIHTYCFETNMWEFVHTKVCSYEGNTCTTVREQQNLVHTRLFEVLLVDNIFLFFK